MQQIKAMKKYAFKKHVKKKINEGSFNYLETLKASHSKVKNILYRKQKLLRI